MLYIEHQRSDGSAPDMVLWGGDVSEGVYRDAFRAEVHAAYLRERWSHLVFTVRRMQGPVRP